MIDANRLRHSARAAKIHVANGNNFGGTDTPKRLGVYSTDKAGADDSRPNP
jgi:hypothetical protein